MRQLYGQRSERQALFSMDQMQLELEELNASATEDETRCRDRGWPRPPRSPGSPASRPETREPPSQSISPESVWSIEGPSACECCGGASACASLARTSPSTLEVDSRAPGRSSRPCGRNSRVGTARRSARPRRRSTSSPAAWAGPSLLAMILYEKFGAHQPLNRLCERFALEGVPIPLSTMPPTPSAPAVLS